MGEQLNVKTILASIAEFRESMDGQFARLSGEAAELRKNMDERFAKFSENIDGRFAKFGKDMAKSNAELRASISEQGVKFSKETAELRAKLDANNAKLDANNAKLDANNAKLEANNAKLDANNHKIDSLINKLGGLIENVVVPGIVEKFNEKGFAFDSVSTNVKLLKEESVGVLTEIDVLLENGKFAIAVETKNDMHTSDVSKHIKRLEKLRTLSRFKGKKLYGAFTIAAARQKTIDYALEHGLYVLQQPDAMKVKILDFPKGYSAKAW